MRWSLAPPSSRDILGNSSHEHLTRHKNFCFRINILLNHNTHWLSLASVITALAGRRHSDWRKSQSDCLGQGLHRGGTALRRLRHWEMWAVWQPPEYWEQPSVHCLQLSSLDWLLWGYLGPQHTSTNPNPTTQPGIPGPLCWRNCIMCGLF